MLRCICLSIMIVASLPSAQAQPHTLNLSSLAPEILSNWGRDTDNFTKNVERSEAIQLVDQLLAEDGFIPSPPESSNSARPAR